tara:strand:+ start:1795 stop:2061 length:267 start_codon:yes stop_codon:yes gene_type:complete
MSATKLTKKELGSLQEALGNLRTADSNFTNASKNLRRVTQAADEAWDALAVMESDLNAMQSSMMEKYGDVNINVTTGEFVDPEVSEEE